MTPPTWGGEPSTRRRRMLLFRRLKPRATRRKSLTPHILHRSTPHRGISTCRQVKGRCASKRGSRWTTPSQSHHLRTLAPITLLTCPFASQRLAIAPIALVSNYVNPTSLTLLRSFRGWRGAWVTATNVGLRESENPTLTHLHLHAERPRPPQLVPTARWSWITALWAIEQCAKTLHDRESDLFRGLANFWAGGGAVGEDRGTRAPELTKGNLGASGCEGWGWGGGDG